MVPVAGLAPAKTPDFKSGRSALPHTGEHWWGPSESNRDRRKDDFFYREAQRAVSDLNPELLAEGRGVEPRRAVRRLAR